MPPATLRELLSKAGADITVEQIAAWTADEQMSARVFAEGQLEASAEAVAGAHVSLRWPAHVSQAHHGGNHYPKRERAKR